MRQWLVLAGFIALCISVGSLAGWVTVQSVAEWYPTLNKPSWTPPSWLFGPVWSVLYVMMAIAAWLVWRAGNAQVALTWFGVQLLFNFGWSFLFFGQRSPSLGLLDIILLWSSIVVTIYLFNKKSRLAAILMLPYLAWVSFASALNAAIWVMN